MTFAIHALMKVVELGNEPLALDEVMALAEEELVVLRKPDGSVFALSQVDDFDVEAQLLKDNPDFMAFDALVARKSVALAGGTPQGTLRLTNCECRVFVMRVEER